MAITINKASGNGGASGAPAWMLRGQAAQAAIQHEQAKAEAAQASFGKMRRFGLKLDEEKRVTFLDGDLNSEGLLDILYYYEHSLQLGGDWTPVICLSAGHGDQGSQPCPACEGGDKSSLVGVLTVNNHSPYTIKNGQNAGKVLVNVRQLYVAKKTTLAVLQKLAVKRGGLRGVTFDITRTGDKKTPGVGTHFEFVEKRDYETLKGLYGDDANPADYGKELIYRTAAEMIKLGIGKAPAGPGYEGKFDTNKLSDEM